MILKRIFQSGSDIELGQKAPDFSLPNENNQLIKLSDFKGKWVVLFFYPKDFSMGCTAEVCSFRDNFDEFKKVDAVLLGINTDTVESHKEFIAKHNLPFSLLSDTSGEVSKNYGVLLFGKLSNRETFFISPDSQIKGKLSWVNWFNYADAVQKKLSELKNK
jgi:peroxiredoxin Q/BCP